MTESLICIGKVTAAHGIKGYVKIASFMDNPEDIKKHTVCYDKAGKKEYRIRVVSFNNQTAIAEIKGVSDRNAAELLRHAELYIPRDSLPEIEEGAFYWEDLKGLDVVLSDGTNYGKVIAMHNFGAGDIIEIENAATKKTDMFSFDERTISEVDLDAEKVVLCLPDVIMVASEESPTTETSDKKGAND